MKKILSIIKKIIFAVCGKLRWLLLIYAVCWAFQIFTSVNICLNTQFSGITGEDGKVITETPVKMADNFSVNKKGIAVMTKDNGISDRLMAYFNINTGETIHTYPLLVPIDTLKDEYFFPDKYVLTDDNTMYAVVKHTKGDYSDDVLTKETVVRVSDQHEYIDEICQIEYGDTENRRDSKISELHYNNETVSFAVMDIDGIRLYKIDTKTNEVSISHTYPSDENGVCTVNVIPVDEGFLFVMSSGDVYMTSFDEKYGECIYHFDNTGNAPFFTDAVISNEHTYIYDKNNPYKVWEINDGNAEVIFDVALVEGHQTGDIKYIGSYNLENGDNAIAICLDDGLFTYSDGELTEKNIIIKINKMYLRYFRAVWEFIGNNLPYLIIVNLIIRKKTLFYKQMIVTVPVFSVIAIVLAVKVYDFTVNSNYEKIKDELEIIDLFGARALEGYDFSGLMEIDEDTGAEYLKLCKKINEISTGHTMDWSYEFNFSVVYRIDDNRFVTLACDNKTIMPMCSDYIYFSDSDAIDLNSTTGVFIDENINSFISDEARQSEMSAYGRIDDSNNSGNIFFKVTTANRSFWYMRRQLILGMAYYATLVICLLSAISLLTSLYIRGAVKKASEVVKKISAGDLTARIKYKSKDELGEICTQVNEMGQSLENLFEEKDRTERFYYKFVPEQFRKLLGKNSFTDLSLGDSSSRELTVLFCDIRSFSINSEIMTAKENFEFVNIIYGIAGPIIRKNGGFVDKYIGDAVMALFENADDAVKSGIEIYKSIVLDPATAKKLGVSDINIGIGIHSGMAMVGIVGEEERLSGTVISDTVNLSSRLESLTKQYKTAMLISKDTVDRMSDPDSLDLRYLGIVQVAGVNEVKAVYEVLDCMPDGEREKRHENSHELREAIRLFHLGRRDETVKMLRDISESGNSDYVTELYLEYIRNLSPEEKGNVFRFVRK